MELYKQISVYGSSVAYFEKNSGNTSIVFLHGNSLSSGSFSRQFDFEGFKGFRLLGIDFPGHGHSEPAINPADHYNLFFFRDLVVETVRKLKIDNFILAGHSLGGHVAMECLPFLQGCKGLMIWAAPPVRLPLDLGAIFLPDPSLDLLFKKELDETEITRLAALMADEIYIPEMTGMIRQSDPDFRAFLPVSLTRQMVSDEYGLLAGSGLPVAIMHGENDRIISNSYTDQLSIPALWKKKVILLRNASHTPQLEAAGDFNRHLLDFCLEVL
ncbi:MAG: alpha/beta hydrolase [Bacteroidales bacterium]|jgi:pimeloyl-ACP methyl ester carboxylesterase|nr:alpha/beta hydrolase [Bacteroidales bacterium]